MFLETSWFLTTWYSPVAATIGTFDFFLKENILLQSVRMKVYWETFHNLCHMVPVICKSSLPAALKWRTYQEAGTSDCLRFVDHMNPCCWQAKIAMKYAAIICLWMRQNVTCWIQKQAHFFLFLLFTFYLFSLNKK